MSGMRNGTFKGMQSGGSDNSFNLQKALHRKLIHFHILKLNILYKKWIELLVVQVTFPTCESALIAKHNLWHSSWSETQRWNQCD